MGFIPILSNCNIFRENACGLGTEHKAEADVVTCKYLDFFT